MDIRHEVLEKYKEFSDYLKSIDVENLKTTFSRQELKEFKEELSDIKLRSVSYEISQLITNMKKEEFPELLGVHHYPDLKEIDFMSESKKIELDNYLVRFRKDSYVFNLWKFSTDVKKLEQFLLEKGIIEERYFFTCTVHFSERLTGGLTKEEMEIYKTAIIEKDHDILEDFYDGLYCEECEDSVEYKEWDDEYLTVKHVLVKNRDTSLENV